MADKGPILGARDWLLYRLMANYWSLPLVAIILAPLIAFAGVWFDRALAAQWLVSHDLSPVVTADTAQDFAIAIVALDAALFTFYLSATLIVLTLATGNLGVRLVDRWLEKQMIRNSWSGLVFCLVFALVLLMTIDPKAPLEQLPLATIWLSFALQLINLGMLGVAAHDLGRTMFVDRAIAHLGADAAAGGMDVVGGQPHHGAWQQRIVSEREGYVEGLDLAAIAQILGPSTRARFVAAPGQHVLCGEPVVLLTRSTDCPEEILAAIPIGEFRTNAENAVFQIRLLVEIAARALSPGINDFYTALTCADRISCAMLGQVGNWVDEGAVPISADFPQFEVPGQDFRGLFDDPLNALRQAAAPYPSVAIRMIDNYARVAAMTDAAQLHQFLESHASSLAEHATMRAELAMDAQAISGRYARWSEMVSTRKAEMQQGDRV